MKRRPLPAVVLVFLILASGATATADPCQAGAVVTALMGLTSAAAAGTAALDTELKKINEYGPPKALWDFKSGEAKVDLSFVRDEVIPQFRKISQWNGKDFVPDDALLEIDGDSKHLVPVSQEQLEALMKGKAGEPPVLATFKPGHRFRQIDVKIVLRKGGKEVWVSEPGMSEDIMFPRADPASAGRDAPKLSSKLPADLLARNHRDADWDPIAQATRQEYEIIQTTIDPETKNQDLLTAFRDHGRDLKFERVVDAKTGQVHWNVTDPATEKVIQAAESDVWDVLNAGFNSNLFKWDGDEGNWGLAWDNPTLAMNWIRARYKIQKILGNGLQPRESHAYNLTPYQRAMKTKLTKTGPVARPNGEFINPPRTGSAYLQVLPFLKDFDPKDAEKVLKMSQWERQALVREYGKKGKNGELLGFEWTNLGSGRDNAPRCLGQPGCLAVDMITYYKMMLDDEAEIAHLLGRFKKAEELQKESAKIKDLINREYWNDEAGLYTDLIVAADGSTQHSKMLTMVSFWPMMAKIPDKTRLNRMITENLHNPKRFGDGPFPPAVAADRVDTSDSKVVLHYWQGNYWNGGGFWPIDGRWLMEGLYVNGLRAEAEAQYGRIMGGVNEASRWYRKNGDTPYALVHGEPSAEEKRLMKKQGVFWEAYGRVTDPATGKLRPTYNREQTGDGSWHQTRPGLAWSLVLAKSGKKYEEGFDAIPAFMGSKGSLPAWYHELLTNELYSHREISHNPTLRPLVDFLHHHSLSRTRFQEMWTQPNSPLGQVLKKHPEIRDELDRVGHGYLEVSPTFDPEKNQTALEVHFKENTLNLEINDLGNYRVQLVFDPPKEAVPIQFNAHWGVDGKALDAPAASSPIVDLSEKNPKVIRLPDGKLSLTLQLG